MNVLARNWLTRVAPTFALLHICLNALVMNSVWSQGLAVCASPSATGVPLMITVFCRSLLSLFAYKIDSSMGKLYINSKFLRKGIVGLLLCNNQSWSFQAAHHGKQTLSPSNCCCDYF